MVPQEDVTTFISTSFRSIWSLELMLLLKRQPSFHGRKELEERLRGSELVISQALDGLVAAGLVTLDGEGRAKFQPATDNLLALTEATEDLYTRKPGTVRRLIVARAAPGLSAFADAFRLRRD